MSKLREQSSVVVRPESIDVIRLHGVQLIRDHWQEVALNKRLMALAPDWKRYYALEEQGQLLVLTAWDVSRPKEETLVGYSISFITNHLHYERLKVCQNDVLFISRTHRGHGKQLIVRTEHAAFEKGCRMILWHAKPNTVLERVLPKSGYGVQDIVFSKEL